MTPLLKRALPLLCAAVYAFSEKFFRSLFESTLADQWSLSTTDIEANYFHPNSIFVFNPSLFPNKPGPPPGNLCPERRPHHDHLPLDWEKLRSRRVPASGTSAKIMMRDDCDSLWGGGGLAALLLSGRARQNALVDDEYTKFWMTDPRGKGILVFFFWLSEIASGGELPLQFHPVFDPPCAGTLSKLRYAATSESQTEAALSEAFKNRSQPFAQADSRPPPPPPVYAGWNLQTQR